MMLILAVIALLAVAVAIYLFVESKKLKADIVRVQNEAETALAAKERESQAIIAESQKLAEERIAAIQQESVASLAEAQKLIDQQFAEMQQEAERVRQHYEAESRKSRDAAESLLAKTIKDFEPLRKYERFRDAEAEAERQLSEALTTASALRAEAQALLEHAKTVAGNERALAVEKARDIREQAEALLTQATRDAGRIVADAEKRAEQIGGEAYEALRDKQLLQQAAAAMRNIIDGYGDRYIVPTHSLLDELAAEFGYDAAGQTLKAAREQSRRMVEQAEAAACDYAEANRRATAIQFVIAAFNGRVDGILSRSRYDNFGTLEQEIKDAFSLVNFNGQAFRNARILPAYLDARLAELKWAAVVHELARKQREEQRFLKERLRDEEKARKENEERMRQAAKEEELKRQAVEEAEKRFREASVAEKAQMEQQLQKLRQDLLEATTRKLTIAQQTKKGHVYIISNVGAFGENVFKIGQTRRPDPQDRIDELSDASVPFEFDIHALIESDNAPLLEHRLHKQFLALQINKMNYRKEFFRVNLSEIRQAVDRLNEGVDFTVKQWTDKAIATEYKESIDIDSDPEKKAKWLARQKAMADRQIKIDTLRLPESQPELSLSEDEPF